MRHLVTKPSQTPSWTDFSRRLIESSYTVSLCADQVRPKTTARLRALNRRRTRVRAKHQPGNDHERHCQPDGRKPPLCVVLQGDESDGRTNTTGDFVEESPSGAPQHTTDLPDILPDRDAKGGEIQGIAPSKASAATRPPIQGYRGVRKLRNR